MSISLVKSIGAEILALPYRLRFGHLGRRPRLRPPIMVSGAQRVQVGDNAWIEPFVALSVDRGGLIKIGNGCELRAFARLEADVGRIVIGNRCSVNPFCVLNGFGGIVIGNEVRIASHSVILSSSHRHEAVDVSIHAQGMQAMETLIGDDVWIGTHCVITGGVHIGSHSIIAAGSVVLKDVPEYAVAAGIPARVVRMRRQ